MFIGEAAPEPLLRALESAVATGFGPLPRQKLLVTAARRVVITSSGASVLAALVTEHPVVRLVIDMALDHVARCGDGAASFVLMVCAGLRDVSAQLRGLPPHCRRTHVVRVARGLLHLAQARPAPLFPPRRAAPNSRLPLAAGDAAVHPCAGLEEAGERHRRLRRAASARERARGCPHRAWQRLRW